MSVESLKQFLNTPDLETFSRLEIVKKFIDYCAEKNLYNTDNKMLIQCDELLREVLGVESFAFFGLDNILDKLCKRDVAAEAEAEAEAPAEADAQEEHSGSEAEAEEDEEDEEDESVSEAEEQTEEAEAPEDAQEEEEAPLQKGFVLAEEGVPPDALTPANSLQVLLTVKHGVATLQLNQFEMPYEQFLSSLTIVKEDVPQHLHAEEANRAEFDVVVVYSLLGALAFCGFFSLWLTHIVFGLDKIKAH